MPHNYFFVYGTLRRGEMRDINLLRPAPVWIGRASVLGHLFDLGHYPGLALGGAADGNAGPVWGEVYAVDPELERMLDEIEEVWPQQTGEYSKQAVLVVFEGRPASEAGQAQSGAQTLPCFVYEIDASRTHGKPRIACGDWVTYRQRLIL